MTWFSEKMLIFNIWRRDLTPNLIKKSWTVSNQGPLGNIVHHNFDHGEHDDDALMPKVRILFIHIIEGPIKEFWDFEATLFVGIEFRKCTNKYI